MTLSVLDDKSITPNDEQLKKELGRTFPLWNDIIKDVADRCGEITQEWNFPGQKYGWSLRLKYKKRAILYLIPCKKNFLTAFVFGDKAVAAVEQSNLPKSIIETLKEARKYAEGRGIRIEVRKRSDLANIKTLTEIKLAN